MWNFYSWLTVVLNLLLSPYLPSSSPPSLSLSFSPLSFSPSQNQVYQPAGLMQRILGDIHYMPDHWKKQPHTLTVYKEFTHVFQFTMVTTHPK